MSRRRHVVDLNKKNPCYRMHRVIPEYLQTLSDEKYGLFMRSLNETFLKGKKVEIEEPQDKAMFNIFKTILDYENIVKRKKGERSKKLQKRHRIDFHSIDPSFQMNRVIPEYISFLPDEKRLMFYHSMTEVYLKGNEISFGDPKEQALFNLFKTILDYENIVVGERRKP